MIKVAIAACILCLGIGSTLGYLISENERRYAMPSNMAIGVNLHRCSLVKILAYVQHNQTWINPISTKISLLISAAKWHIKQFLKSLSKLSRYSLGLPLNQ